MLEPDNKPDNEMNPAEEAAKVVTGTSVRYEPQSNPDWYAECSRESLVEAVIELKEEISEKSTDFMSIIKRQSEELAILRGKEEHRMQELAKERSKNIDERLSEFVRAEIKRAIANDVLVDSQTVSEMIHEEIDCETMGRDEVEEVAYDCISYNPEGWVYESEVENLIENHEFDFVGREDVEDMILDNMGSKTDVSDLEARIEELENKLCDVAAILE